MAAGFLSGFLADKISPGKMSAIGCAVTLVSLIVFLFFDQYTSWAKIEGMLFFAGIGIGIFGSPNNMSMMLSVDKHHRGVAAATSMFTLMCTSMIGIVLTFHFVLDSMSKVELFDLFIYGGSSLTNATLKKFHTALQNDYYIVIGVCVLGIICALRNNIAVPGKPPASTSKVSVDGGSSKQENGVEMVNAAKSNNTPPSESADTPDENGAAVVAAGGYGTVASQEV